MNDPAEAAPVIVGVDGSVRSIDAFVSADVLAAALRTRLVIAYVHSFGKLSSVFPEDEHELIVRGIAESTCDQIRDYLPSVPERRLQLVSDRSPAAGRHTLAEQEQAALMVVGSSHRSNIGRILVGGTADRLLTGASVPVAIAPAGYSAARRPLRLVGCGFDGSPESQHALAWAAELARTAWARLCILAVHERALLATLALNGGLAAGLAQRHPAAPAHRAACRSSRSPRPEHRGQPDAPGRRRPRPTQQRLPRARPARTRVARIRTRTGCTTGKRLGRTGPFSPIPACRRTAWV